MLSGPVQHFRSAVLQPGGLLFLLNLLDREGFRGVQLLDIKGSYNYLSLLT